MKPILKLKEKTHIYIIEQDHRFIKRKVKSMLGFDSFETAEEKIMELNPCI